MFKRKYIITVESESPPQIRLGDKIGDATVIALEAEQYPELVDLTWLTKRFRLSRDTLSTQLASFNIGGHGKNLYDPNIVVPFLKSNIKTKRGRPRKN